MSFLQINNASPSEKRPFRLSDIQDIWNGIKSLFKAISGQQFRIISGFDLVSGTYTSGTVWYNGELYEYDSSVYPITPSTTRVAFSRIAQDDRTLEGGSIQPFSYKYVCGGDALNGSMTFTYFVAEIEKYKSFLGNGSVTTSKLANKAVTLEKLDDSLVSGVLNSYLHQSPAPYESSSTVTLRELFTSSSASFATIAPATNSAWTCTIDTREDSNGLPTIIPLRVRNKTGHSGTLKIKSPSPSGSPDDPLTYDYTIESGKLFTLLLVHSSDENGGYVVACEPIKITEPSI